MREAPDSASVGLGSAAPGLRFQNVALVRSSNRKWDLVTNMASQIRQRKMGLDRIPCRIVIARTCLSGRDDF
jgi:hypothetical protein